MTREEIIKGLSAVNKECGKQLGESFAWMDEIFQEAIEELEQEPCDDLEREYKKNKALFHKMVDENDAINRQIDKIIELIEELPPVNPVACIAEIKFSKEDMQELVDEKIKEITAELEERKWIPVKERLPETDGEYLLFGRIDESDEYYKFIGTFDAGAEEFGIWQECFDYNTLGCIGSEFYEYDEVLAWMPLPDDYKEGVEE